MLFHSTLFRNVLREHPLSILDGGARGQVTEPFLQIDKHLRFVLRFDPDPDAPIAEDDPGATIRAALWNRSETVSLHLAFEPSTSSLFPPDEGLLTQFHDRFGYPPRRTVRTIDVQGVSLDEVLAAHPEYPQTDVLKLDIHGAEYEALEGAQEALRHALAVIVETWTLPIHRGQRIHAEVESLLYRHGFVLFHTERTAAMERKNPWNVESRTQIVGFENVYFRDLSPQTERPGIFKAIALAEIFGHVAYALQLVERFAERIGRAEAERIAAELRRMHPMPSRWTRLARRVKRRIIRLFGGLA